MNAKSKLTAIVAGTLVTLTLGAVALAILFHYYHGNVPWVPAVLAPFLCSLIGGHLATRLARARGLTTGALSGLVAGLMAIALVALVTKGVNTTLAAVLLTVIFAVGGAVGGWLTRVRLSLELA